MAARMMLAKPSLPLHLLRGSLSAASAPLNLNMQPNSPVDPQQIHPRADESSVCTSGLSSLLQQLRLADLNRVEFREKSVPAEDDDNLDDDDFEDSSDLDGCFLDNDYDEDEDSDDDDDDEDEKGKGKFGRRRK